MADAAHVILTQDAKTFTGRFCIDDTLLYEHGVRDFDKYRVDPSMELAPDFFVPEAPSAAAGRDPRRAHAVNAVIPAGLSPGCRSHRLHAGALRHAGSRQQVPG